MAQIQKEEAGWDELAIFICSKCKTLFDAHTLASAEPAEDLKASLKARFKQDGLSEKCRAMTTSCQNLCKNNIQAITFCKNNGQTQTFGMHPERDREELYQLILAEL